MAENKVEREHILESVQSLRGKLRELTEMVDSVTKRDIKVEEDEGKPRPSNLVDEIYGVIKDCHSLTEYALKSINEEIICRL